MVRDASRPLTTDEAKARFLTAAKAATPTAWVRRYPLRALTLAVIGGFIAARVRLPPTTGMLLTDKILLPFLINITRNK